MGSPIYYHWLDLISTVFEQAVDELGGGYRYREKDFPPSPFMPFGYLYSEADMGKGLGDEARLTENLFLKDYRINI